MLESYSFETFEQFLEWYRQLNPKDTLDKREALELFFNLESYAVLGI
jgi:hypothetical protein